MGGKNSVFRKPGGTGKNSLSKKTKPISKIVKKVNNTVKGVRKELGKGASNIVRESGKGVNNVGREAGRSWDKNKDGINGTIGTAGRGYLAVQTMGMSEAVGAGDIVSNSFGRKGMGQYGDVVGAGAALATGNITTLATTKMLVDKLKQGDVSGVVNAYAGYGGDNMGFSDFLGSDIGKQISGVGVDYFKKQLGMNKQTSSKNKKVSLPPATISVPVPMAKDNNDEMKNMMLAGGAVAILLTILVLNKKG